MLKQVHLYLNAHDNNLQHHTMVGESSFGHNHTVEVCLSDQSVSKNLLRAVACLQYVTCGAGSKVEATQKPLANTSVFSEDAKTVLQFACALRRIIMILLQGFASISANRTHLKTQLVDAAGNVLHEFFIQHEVGETEFTRCPASGR